MARQEAKRLRKVVDLGGDPLGDIEAAREKAADERKRSKTVNDLIDRFKEEHLPGLRPATRKFYGCAFTNHIAPAIGKKRVQDVERGDVEKLFKKLTGLGQRHQANQCIVITGVLFRYAVDWGWRTGENPARNIDKNHGSGRERYLLPAESRSLAKALEALEDRQAAAILKVLLLTGARVGETCQMRWEQLDFARAIWTKPASVTKQKRDHRLPLTAPVLEVLAKIKQEQSPKSEWVFPGRSKEGYRNDMRSAWAAALKAAEIQKLRMSPSPGETWTVGQSRPVR
ncbi:MULTISPECIES: site-specific integrase [unclassified Mesorhizobium]|uniref:tyrosine-type recombinase/integrase n=1 Tax=unclassified Mesorhizobium TaxID=325217 RepID=UPI001678C24E|nr:MULTISPECIES: site-specific integrase [unclassified Mesorhizobium]